MSAARPSTTLDDPQVRVTTWTFDAPGDSTGSHVHEYDYVVVPVTGGIFSVTDTEGSTHDMSQHAGSPYRGSAGTKHTVTSATDRAIIFVEVELKR